MGRRFLANALPRRAQQERAATAEEGAYRCRPIQPTHAGARRSAPTALQCTPPSGTLVSLRFMGSVKLVCYLAHASVSVPHRHICARTNARMRACAHRYTRTNTHAQVYDPASGEPALFIGDTPANHFALEVHLITCALEISSLNDEHAR